MAAPTAASGARIASEAPSVNGAAMSAASVATFAASSTVSTSWSARPICNRIGFGTSTW